MSLCTLVIIEVKDSFYFLITILIFALFHPSQNEEEIISWCKGFHSISYCNASNGKSDVKGTWLECIPSVAHIDILALTGPHLKKALQIFICPSWGERKILAWYLRHRLQKGWTGVSTDQEGSIPKPAMPRSGLFFDSPKLVDFFLPWIFVCVFFHGQKIDNAL